MIILRKSLTLFLCWSIFVLSFPVNVSAQEKRSIAVLNLQGRGISALEAETLTEYMRSEVEETGGFRSVGAGEIKGTLESQGLEETGCQTDDCALETGSLLGVSYVVMGSVEKSEEGYDLGCRMLNVETGELQKSVKRTYRGDVDGLIMTVQRIVWDIVGLTPPPERFPPEMAAEVSGERSLLSQGKLEIALVFLFLVVMAIFARSGSGGGSPIGSPPDFP